MKSPVNPSTTTILHHPRDPRAPRDPRYVPFLRSSFGILGSGVAVTFSVQDQHIHVLTCAQDMGPRALLDSTCRCISHDTTIPHGVLDEWPCFFFFDVLMVDISVICVNRS